MAEFVKLKAEAMSSNQGYFTTAVLATTGFLASHQSIMDLKTHHMPLNTYSAFVGPPTTGKSVAIAKCSQEPIQTIAEDFDLGEIIINKPTSSAMQRILSDLKKGIMISAEIFDPLNKLMKSDDENASGDALLLCELFSGEQTSYRFATEKTRKIEKNTPFTVLGCTQLPYAARLIARLDRGHGLVDRINFVVPNCLRPSPEETKSAIQQCEKMNVKEIGDIFYELQTMNLPKTFLFAEEAMELYEH